MRRLLFSALLVCAPLLQAASFTNGQAARAEIGQFFFNSAGGPVSNVILGGPQGIAYWNGNLFVADSNVLGAGWPITTTNSGGTSTTTIYTGNRILQFPVTNIPSVDADLSTAATNDALCNLCGYPASNVLGQNSFNTYGSGLGPISLNSPTAVATDGHVLAVADTANNRVLLWFAPAGGTVTNLSMDQAPNLVLGQKDFSTLQPAGTVNQSTLAGPQGVWIQDGRLFVADTGNNRVLIWNRMPTQNNQGADLVLGQPNFGTANAPVASNPVAAANTMWAPSGVSSDGVRLYVADTGFSRVLIWNSIPTSQDQNADIEIGQQDMTGATPDNSVALCASNGTDSSGNPTFPPMCASTLNFPRFALSDGQRLFVADSGNDRVLVYTLIPTFNRPPANIVLGQPNFTTDVLVTPDTSITSTTVDNTGSTDTLATPTSLAFDGTNLYVADTFNRRIVLYSPGDLTLSAQAVLNAASEETHQEGVIQLGGTPATSDTVTITIQGTNYTYTVTSTDTLQTITAALIKKINSANSNAGDPNVFALAGSQVDTIYLASKAANLGLDAISLAATSSDANLLVVANGAYLTGGNGGTVAPGSLIEINYSKPSTSSPGLADSTVYFDPSNPVPLSEGQSMPTSLGGAQVFIDGNPAPILYASPTQVKAQVPFEYNNRSTSSLYVRTKHNDGSVTVTTATPLMIAPADPGLFRDTTSSVNPPPALSPQHQTGNPSVSLDISLPSVQAGDVVTVTINGRTYSYTIQSSDTLASVTSSLVSAIKDPQVTASTTGSTGTLLLTAVQSGAAGSNIPVSATTTPASGQTSAAVSVTTSNSVTCCSDAGTGAITVNNPAQPGETITLYGTGLGVVQDANNNPIGVQTGAPYNGPAVNSATNFAIATVGSTYTAVPQSGLSPAGIGVYSVQVSIPNGSSTGSAVPIHIAQNAYISNSVTVPIGTPPGALSTILATPNPIVVASGATTGQTTISWNTSVTTSVQIRVNAPNGALFATGTGQSSAQTGNWVTDGMIFYMQDATQSDPTSASATIGTVTVHLTTQSSGGGGTGGGGTGGGGTGTQPVFGQSCPSNAWTVNSGTTFSINPGIIQVPTGVDSGEVSISWTTLSTITSTTVYVVGPGGSPQVFASGGSYGLGTSGDWVSEGTMFFLQNGTDETSGSTLACGIAHVQHAASSLGTLTASPQTIITSQSVGQTILSWSCPVCTSTQVRVGSPTGQLFAKGLSSGSATTGNWVSNGTTFYLLDQNGNQIATTTVSLEAQSSGGSGGGNTSSGIITGTPNPILYPNGGSAVGQTTVAWSCVSCTHTEVHIGSPNGPLFATGLSNGTATTGNWVTNGTVFYLQDSSNGNAGSSSNTVATFTAVLQQAPPGPPSYSNGGVITANPNPVLISGDFGETVLTWSCNSCTSSEVHIGAPDGPLFATGTSVGTATTGNWVVNGMRFYLQDSSNGNSTSASNTLAWVEVDTQPE